MPKHDSGRVSVAVGTAKNHYETTTSVGDCPYYILQGKIIVNKNIVGYIGGVIFAPANTTYRFEGTFKAVIINSPPFSKSGEKITRIKETPIS